MKKRLAQASAGNSARSIVFGLAIFGMVVIITWRWLLE